ncbi:MAG: hypothetical protein PVF46_07245 [Lysobacterales bacterium]|jgi:hypothetical protein
MLLLTLYILFTLLVGIGVVHLYRLLNWRRGPGEAIRGQAGSFGQMTIKTQQGFISLFESDRRKESAARRAPVRRKRRAAQPGHIKRPWGW